jgi:UDP-N-acetylmuramoyl-L-alanyl-D-glutamate--2,6-diaminopimelate ligase
MLHLQEIIQLLPVKSQQNLDLNLEVKALSFDSRQVQPGHLFFCLQGELTDGHQFAEQALKAGAIALVADQLKTMPPEYPVIYVSNVRLALAQVAAMYYQNPSQALPTIGVTGTNGKTTVTHLIGQILATCLDELVGVVGTLGYKIQSKSSLQYSNEGSGRTTPEAPELQGILADLRDKNCKHLLMEVSSHALYQWRVAYCNFKVAVFTNLTQDHLDYHQTMENYFAAKGILFSGLQPGAHAVLNADDPWADRFADLIQPDVQLFTYGIQNTQAQIRAIKPVYKPESTEAEIKTPTETGFLELPLNGSFNLYNALASISACLALGLSLQAILQVLKKAQPAPGRFQRIVKPTNKAPTCIVDYAHTPDGLENVLKTAKQILPTGGKLISVFGCGGDRDRTKRPAMGAISAKYADYSFITSDNPRTEDPEQIVADILAGVEQLEKVEIELDRALAIQKAVQKASPEDLVVIAGKGHENYQIFAEKTIHFDDREEVSKALENL